MFTGEPRRPLQGCQGSFLLMQPRSSDDSLFHQPVNSQSPPSPHPPSPQVMKDFVQLKQIEDVLDKGRAVKHSKLSQLTEEVITDPTKVKGGGERGRGRPLPTAL